MARAIRLANDLPPLSAIARRLLTTICSPDAEPSLGEVASWIESDALTSGKVLALANSAFYGRSVPILSVRVAVARLGLNPLRSLILGSSLNMLWSQLPTPRQWSTSRFNAHSIATAVLCEMIASSLTPADSQLAFLAGLLHDTGRLLIAVLVHDNADALVRLNVDHSLEEAERDLIARRLATHRASFSESTSHSPATWRCIALEKLRAVELLEGSWKTAPNHSRPATCVVEADIDAEDQPERDPQKGQ